LGFSANAPTLYSRNRPPRSKKKCRTLEAVGRRTPILDWPYRVFGEERNYAVSPDGQRFFGIKEGGTDEAAQPHIILVENWVEELRRLFAESKARVVTVVMRFHRRAWR